MRYELTDNERAAVRPLLPIKPRGMPRVDDRPVLNASFGSLIRRRSSRASITSRDG
jgi:transposase